MIGKHIESFVMVKMVAASSLFAGSAAVKGTITLNQASVGSALTSAGRVASTNTSLLTPQGQAVVTVINNTAFTLRCFVNGKPSGVVDPGDRLPIFVNSRYTRLSARADFPDAPPLLWDSGLLISLPGGCYSWELDN
jgi:hypothetical protein